MITALLNLLSLDRIQACFLNTSSQYTRFCLVSLLLYGEIIQMNRYFNIEEKNNFTSINCGIVTLNSNEK